MNRYFFVVRYLPEDVNPEILAGRCIKTLHLIFTSTGKSIGVCFPEWSFESIGRSIAFISPERVSLEKLHKEPYFHLMVESGIFEISAIEQVLMDCREVRFIRNQRVAKLFHGEKRRRLLRASRRAEQRGESLNPEKLKLEFEVEPFHRAVIDSENNRNRYVLHLQKEVAEEIVVSDYCSYGVATNKERKGTVPDLSFYPDFSSIS